MVVVVVVAALLLAGGQCDAPPAAVVGGFVGHVVAVGRCVVTVLAVAGAVVAGDEVVGLPEISLCGGCVGAA